MCDPVSLLGSALELATVFKKEKKPPPPPVPIEDLNAEDDADVVLGDDRKKASVDATTKAPTPKSKSTVRSSKKTGLSIL